MNSAPLGQLSRALELLTAPRTAWTRIAADRDPIKTVFFGYVMVFGSLNPLCLTIGRLVFGEPVLGFAYRPPLSAALLEGVLGYGLILLSIWGLALLINGLAPPFGAKSDLGSAFRIAAYSSTGGWAGSIFYLYPPLGFMALAGQIFTLYLLYAGVRTVLRPEGRTSGFVALVVVCYAILMMLVISLSKLLGALA